MCPSWWMRWLWKLTKGERLCLKPMVTRVSLSCFNPKEIFEQSHSNIQWSAYAVRHTKTHKDVTTKAATEAIEKVPKHVRSKTGQLIREKIYDKLDTPKPLKHQRQDTRDVKQHKQGTGFHISPQEDKGEEIIKFLHTQTENKTITIKRACEYDPN